MGFWLSTSGSRWSRCFGDWSKLRLGFARFLQVGEAWSASCLLPLKWRLMGMRLSHLLGRAEPSMIWFYEGFVAYVFWNPDLLSFQSLSLWQNLLSFCEYRLLREVLATLYSGISRLLGIWLRQSSWLLLCYRICPCWLTFRSRLLFPKVQMLMASFSHPLSDTFWWALEVRGSILKKFDRNCQR